VHPHEDVPLPGHIAVDQRDVLRLVHVVLIPDDGELAEIGGNPRLGHAVHQLLGLEPVGHELRDGDERQIVLPGDLLQLRAARHRAVGVEDLADDAGGHQPGEPRQIDARLRLPHPLQHAPGPGAQGKDVPWAAQIGRHRCGIDGDVDGGGAVAGRDPGGHAEAPLGVDADRKAVESPVFRLAIWEAQFAPPR
jgi:hypothetical protein